MSRVRPVFPLVFSFCLLPLCHAVVHCNGVLTSGTPIGTDVFVNGGHCTLRDTTVLGSVSVMNGGRLITAAGVTVTGSIYAFRSGAVSLEGNLLVHGGVTVMYTNATVVVGPRANVHIFSVSAVQRVLVFGSMTSLTASNTGAIEVHGASINGGGIVRRGGYANMRICAATVSGGISYNEVHGHLLAVTDVGCPASKITGSVIVGAGVGDVRIEGNKLRASDVIVTRQNGNVVLRSATISDLILQSVTGNIVLDRVVADSDGTVSMTKGSVTVVRSKIRGDFTFSRNQGVRLDRNNFGFEVVNVVNNYGIVHVTGNWDFSISLVENEGVVFNGNHVHSAEISKNRVTTVLNNNRFGTINCADNVPPPRGKANFVTRSATGQCAVRTKA